MYKYIYPLMTQLYLKLNIKEPKYHLYWVTKRNRIYLYIKAGFELKFRLLYNQTIVY